MGSLRFPHRIRRLGDKIRFSVGLPVACWGKLFVSQSLLSVTKQTHQQEVHMFTSLTSEPVLYLTYEAQRTQRDRVIAEGNVYHFKVR